MKLVITIILLCVTQMIMAQKPKKFNVQLPNIACEECKTIIEQKFAKGVDGILAIDVKWRSKYAKITYLEDRIDTGNIRLLLAEYGFDADNEIADTKMMQRLPPCCQRLATPKVADPVPPAPPKIPKAETPTPAVVPTTKGGVVTPTPAKPTTKPVVLPTQKGIKKPKS